MIGAVSVSVPTTTNLEVHVMKGIIALFCAVALAKADPVRTKLASYNADPKQAPIICAKDDSDGILIAHEICNRFYQCWNGEPVVRSCYGNLQYNPSTEVCDWPHSVECGERIIPDEVTSNENSDNGETGGDNNSGAGNCDPSQAGNICAKEGSEGTLVAHENCNKYYICNQGTPVVQICPKALVFDPSKNYCDLPEKVDCGNRVICEEDNSNIDNGGTENGGNGGSGAGNCDPSQAGNICASEGSDGVLVAHENCNKYYICNNGIPVVQKCPDTLLFDPLKDICDWPDKVVCGDRTICDEDESNTGNGNGDSDNGGNGITGAGNCDPSQAVNICAKQGSEGTLVAHENCNKYYICNNGAPVVQRCPGNLLFDPFKDYCDWPENVDCGDRVISEKDSGEVDSGNGGSDNGGNGNGNGDSDNGGNGAGNCDPSQAKDICAKEGSEGTFVAHENCNKYYICNHDVPVVQICPGNLLFDPFKDYCDWPENVDCGDRVITENDSEEVDSGNGGSDNGGNGNGNGDSDNGGNGAGNCDPSQAGDICAKEGSEGTLVAHDNCNKYYICNHGVPVVQKCPGNLLFDPFKDYCDWPEKVDCGDRVISENDSEEVDSGNGGSDNGGNGNGNGDSDNGGNGGNGAGNCDPSQAGDICAKEGSEGTLVAHENCNKYYICNHDVPVVQICPGNLLFDPFKDYCDWPENVDCGDRVITENDSEEVDSGNGGSDNGGNGNGNGDSDNGGNGAGNCDPSQAGDICAKEGSEGTLVAHDNCNKYYICNHGVPVVQKCPGNLLFDPFKDYCDWPEKVDCGDRVISENDSEEVGNGNGESDNGDSDNGGSESGGSDNAGSDNGGSDNGGTGTCNCNPGEAPTICAAVGSDGTLIAHENCNQFYTCVNGRPVTMTCPGSLYYNPHTEVCDWPENVECGDRVIPEAESGEDNNGNGGTDNGGPDDGGNGSSENGGSDNGGSGTCNCNPGEAPAICAVVGSDGTFIAHENCNQFYTCVNGRPVAMTCPSSLYYNPHTEVCDWPENVECGNRVIPEAESEEDNNGSGGTDNGGSDNGGNASSEDGGSDNGGSDNGGSGTCNCNPGEAPTICAVDGSDGTFIAHENCNQFYTCANGKTVTLTCPGSLYYNPHTEVCDWPENVECGDRVIPEAESGEDNNGNGGSDNGGHASSEDGGTDNGGADNGGSGTCNCNPGEAPAICAVDGSDGTFIAHENCNQFYTCVNGRPVTMTCPGSLHYNPHTEVCDWAENVECGDRVIPEAESGEDNNGNGGTDNGGPDDGGNGSSENGGSDNGGSDNGGSDNGGSGTCNCNPGEAPAICAVDGSDGTFIAHENCNQFYTCVNGRPVTMTCPGSLHYNPHTEVCDWPENVECGDRVIPEAESGEDNNGNGGTDNGGPDDGGNGSSENGGSDNGGSDNGGSDNGGSGTCNCNPGEAPAICAVDGSDGTFIAHENCNQFYTCANGKTVTLTCPGSLYYNPHTEVCDWPENVECGDRVIPEAESEEDNNGNGGSDNGGHASSEDGGSDNGGSDNGGSGTCNCNPGEAPTICAVDGSDGTFVAHEHCNQFYTCVNGKPVTVTCPGSLYYNPYTEQCDWPDNVVCGDRIIPEDCEEDNNSNENGSTDTDKSEEGDADNGGSDNGGSDNGGSGTCNCNPGEAPAICAADGSDGAFIAHENCNQFYTCANGKTVTLTCPGSLYYNPHTEVCDWPENVECGDRVIPEAESEEDNNGNGGSDNGGHASSEDGGSDNGGSDNGGSGTCNCNPGEAPTICAVDGSDGTFVAHEHCNQFYTCVNGKPVTVTCPGSLYYNPYTEQCDWPDNVVCGDRIIPEDCEEDSNSNENGGTDTDKSEEGDADNGGSGNGGSDNGGSGTCNCNPGEAPAICAADGSDGAFIAHENCNQFYTCANGKTVTLTCPGSLYYNPHTEVCDWPKNVECGDRVIPEAESEEDNNGNGGSDNGGHASSEHGGSDNGGSDNGGSGTCNCNPGEAPTICAVDGSDGTFVAHEHCNQFYTCVNGKPVTLTCPGSLYYNPYTEQCDWPDNVVCGDRIIPEDCEEDSNSNENGGTDTDKSEEGDADNGGSGNGGSDNGGSGTCNCNPGEAPAICAADGSDGLFIAHENCNQFYTCVAGKPVTITCPGSLHYNPYTEQCDWPDNVVCGDRIIPEDCEEDSNSNENGGTDTDKSEESDSDNGDSDNGGSDNGGSGTCNCNPGEAPAICAADGSDGAYIAHENCNQFYTCVAGKPVTITCPGSLYYNPYTEQCDWPDNVVCGDRIIPEDCEDDSNSNENGGTDAEDTDEGDADSGGSGTCNCNPSEAPAICAADGSDGAFVAHEHCNQFYTCIAGKPVNITCPGSLHYNPYTEQCDWPDNVVCGDRIIPEDCEEDNNSKENGGTDTEDSDEGNADNGGSDNGDSDNEGSDNGGNDSSENGGSDDGGSDNGGSENGGSGTCNCNPAEAPTKCAADGSEGAFVAHENCNQFYTCIAGKPVTVNCSGSLLYNPYTEQCDWPENVNCEGRVIPEICDENNSSGEDEGPEPEREPESGACNCDPAEAPAICAADGSDGVFVAHENCNEFYTCLRGQPVTVSCGGITLYNPHTKRCDWPENVNCGNRIIPEDNNNENEDHDTGGADNGGSDNNGSDNPGSGSYNDNPAEAPAICAADGSDGVFVAHENCNEFYTCLRGEPVTVKCSGITLYNPATQRCDWPENVNCGDREIPQDRNDENENNGSGGSVTDVSATCASTGSEGVLLPHENCNQYYICIDSKPMIMTCSGTLLFNQVTNRCDWPQNVVCNPITSPSEVKEVEDDILVVDEVQGDTDKDETEEGGIKEDVGYDIAVKTCAAENSAGVVVPHEECHRFYVCEIAPF